MKPTLPPSSAIENGHHPDPYSKGAKQTRLLPLWQLNNQTRWSARPTTAAEVSIAHRVRPPVEPTPSPTIWNKAQQAGRFIHHYFTSPVALAIDAVWIVGELFLAQPIFDGVDRVRMKVGWVPPPYENCSEYNREAKPHLLEADRVRRSSKIKVTCVDQPSKRGEPSPSRKPKPPNPFLNR